MDGHSDVMLNTVLNIPDSVFGIQNLNLGGIVEVQQ